MYAGRVVEEASTLEIFRDPLHPYTIGLLQSIPLLGSRTAGETRRLSEIKGMVPSLVALPQGCKFGDRCPRVMKICRQREPELTEIASGRRVRCWLHVETPPS